MSIKNPDTQMCENFKLLRAEKGLSVKELSKLSGVSKYMIKKLETGIMPKYITVTHVFKLCNFFGIKIHKIFSLL